MSFGSPITMSSPQNAHQNSHGESYDRSTSNVTTSFSLGTSFRDSNSTLSPAVGIMTGPPGLGFTPSEMDAYLGIQVVCEKIVKMHGFQSDAVFRVYQEVKDLQKAEEIVKGIKRAAEKDTIERILRVREKMERRVSERAVESLSYWDRDSDQSWTSQQSHDVRDEEGDDDDDQDTDHEIIYKEEADNPDSPLRAEHLFHQNKCSSTPSTS